MAEQELKACPFCGSAVEGESSVCDYIVICRKCIVRMRRNSEHRAEAVLHWNTRPIEDALTARLSSAEAEVERLRTEVDAMGLAMLRIRRDAVTIDDAMTIIDPFDLTAAARRQQGGTA